MPQSSTMLLTLILLKVFVQKLHKDALIACFVKFGM